ncbi:pro-adrenomedullin-like [Polyodon spathula]|uniref:pro-adrenomedullin-like n=1 Tax=Polyodon spathula TaxID=7913 RepID=UPI001B7EF375|nr:pro-adrenomedullin-like [Polyodon spathula]
MKLVLQIVLLYWSLLTVFVLKVETAKLDLTSELKKRLNTWTLNRVKRDLNSLPSSELKGLDTNKQLYVQPEEVKDSLTPHSSTGINIRVKRYRNSVNHFQSLRSGCHLGTCTVHELAHRLYQLTDRDKDNTAPLSKISPKGYGRRRRSVPEHKVIFQLLGRKLQTVWSGTSNRVGKLQEILKRT